MKKLTQKEVEEILRERGLRVTEHRIAVLQAVSGAKTALTVQAIFDNLREKYMIDQATVYRNLNSLHEEGLLRRSDYNHGHAHYELEGGEPSHQIICSTCETIEKIDGVNIDDVVKKMIKKSTKFKKIATHSIEIYGYCKKCASKTD